MVKKLKTETTKTVKELSSEEMFRSFDLIRETALPVEPLWGNFLIKKAITAIIGDPGIGKTSFGYSMTTALCLGQPFLKVYSEEPVNSLYMDFESADSLVSSRSNLILNDPLHLVSIPNLYIYNIADYYIDDIGEKLLKFCKEKEVNLVSIDNQSMAFRTANENDNAEAIEQMHYLRQLANETGAAIILFHHAGKSNLSGTRKGTGAFARARLADIMINIDMPIENKRDIIRFECVKNRMVDEEVIWFLKKEKGQFIFTEPPLGLIGSSNTNTVIYNAQSSIINLLMIRGELSRKEIADKLASYKVRTIDEALERLKKLNRIGQRHYGHYSLV